jgi:hypothetical protein
MSRVLAGWLLVAAVAATGGAAWAAEGEAAGQFQVDVTGTTRDVALGDKGLISIVIVPGAGKKVHDQAPMVVSLKAPVGLGLMKNKLGQADVVNKGAAAPELRAEFSPKQQGVLSVDADLTFFLCTDRWCERFNHKVTIPITVK